MILFVDDNPEYKVKDYGLSMKDSNVHFARNVDAAIEFLKNNFRYDLMYLDYLMSGGHGTKVLEWLSENTLKIPKDIKSCSDLSPYQRRLLQEDPYFNQKIDLILKLKFCPRCGSKVYNIGDYWNCVSRVCPWSGELGTEIKKGIECGILNKQGHPKGCGCGDCGGAG